MIITRFGRPVFIDEILPHLINSAKKRDYPLHALISATLTKMTYVALLVSLMSNLFVVIYLAYLFPLSTLFTLCWRVWQNPIHNM
jgi:hypothetical protein